MDANGKVSAVGSGEAVITVTCGSLTAECSVSCDFVDTTDPEETEPEETTSTSFTLSLLRSDMTLSTAGETFQLFSSSGGVTASDITWTSSDTAVCTVTGGLVKAVGDGTATVTATYQGQTASCIVRCRNQTGSAADDDDSNNDGVYLTNTDVTLSVGESFTLQLCNEDGLNISSQATWSLSETGYITYSNETVKAVAGPPSGYTTYSITVTATYNSSTYSCIVRVKN